MTAALVLGALPFLVALLLPPPDRLKYLIALVTAQTSTDRVDVSSDPLPVHAPVACAVPETVHSSTLQLGRPGATQDEDLQVNGNTAADAASRPGLRANCQTRAVPTAREPTSPVSHAV